MKRYFTLKSFLFLLVMVLWTFLCVQGALAQTSDDAVELSDYSFGEESLDSYEWSGDLSFLVFPSVFLFLDKTLSSKGLVSNVVDFESGDSNFTITITNF